MIQIRLFHGVILYLSLFYPPSTLYTSYNTLNYYVTSVISCLSNEGVSYPFYFLFDYLWIGLCLLFWSFIFIVFYFMIFISSLLIFDRYPVYRKIILESYWCCLSYYLWYWLYVYLLYPYQCKIIFSNYSSYH